MMRGQTFCPIAVFSLSMFIFVGVPQSSNQARGEERMLALAVRPEDAESVFSRAGFRFDLRIERKVLRTGDVFERVLPRCLERLRVFVGSGCSFEMSSPSPSNSSSKEERASKVWIVLDHIARCCRGLVEVKVEVDVDSWSDDAVKMMKHWVGRLRLASSCCMEVLIEDRVLSYPLAVSWFRDSEGGVDTTLTFPASLMSGYPRCG